MSQRRANESSREAKEKVAAHGNRSSTGAECAGR